MNRPRIVCAGCGEPTTIYKPICDACSGLMSEIGHPVCMLCEAALYPGAHVLPADEGGIHKTRDGGHAGKCVKVI